MRDGERQGEWMLKLDHIAVIIAVGAIVVLSIWPLSSSHGDGDHGDAQNGHGDDHEESGHGGPAHWSYAGPDGPEHWGMLSSDYAVCASGRMQSPIDIADPFAATPPTLVFDYKPSPLAILNNGHTVQVNYASGSTLTVEGEVYELLQFHFHAPSEHAIRGARAPMEVHFVHKNAAGALAVVGVMMQAGGASDPLAPVFANMPAAAGPEAAIDGATVDAATMLPPDAGAYFHYKGSLTTPPCSEGVHWFVLANAIQVSADQIGTFEPISAPNARPLQELNNRLLVAAP
jgi:carbonic anhydrase